MTLRRALLVVASLILAGGLLLLAAGTGIVRVVGVYLLLGGLICGAAVLFERYRYRPSGAAGGTLRPTQERFVDPVSGQLLEVWEDPRTGRREYRPMDQ